MLAPRLRTFRGHQCTSEEPLLQVSEHAAEGIGFQVWPASRVLCRFLEVLEGLESPKDGVGAGIDLECPSGTAGIVVRLRGARVLELGAGCGLVSIVAAQLGAAVTATDMGEVIPITQSNASLNQTVVDRAGGKLTVEELPWGTALHGGRGPFDLIVGADLTYFEHLFGALTVTLLQLVDEGTEVLLAHVHRREETECWREESYLGRSFNIELLGTGRVSEQPESVSIYRLRRKPEQDLSVVDEQVNLWLGETSQAFLLARLAQLERDIASIEFAQSD